MQAKFREVATSIEDRQNRYSTRSEILDGLEGVEYRKKKAYLRRKPKGRKKSGTKKEGRRRKRNPLADEVRSFTTRKACSTSSSRLIA